MISLAQQHTLTLLIMFLYAYILFPTFISCDIILINIYLEYIFLTQLRIENY